MINLSKIVFTPFGQPTLPASLPAAASASRPTVALVFNSPSPHFLMRS
ncbi:MAG: hypothetical protein LBF90_01135 [Prevotellaceae bacterium]|jgi:hypothetical protein|nr:hypothetical protein [Prevotellaceae bacterium]